MEGLQNGDRNLYTKLININYTNSPNYACPQTLVVTPAPPSSQRKIHPEQKKQLLYPPAPSYTRCKMKPYHVGYT